MRQVPGRSNEPGEVRLFMATWVCWIVGHRLTSHGVMAYCRRCRSVLGFIEDEEKEA